MSSQSALVALAAATLVTTAAPAWGFRVISLFTPTAPVDAQETIREAPRWNAALPFPGAPSLADGIRVGVQPGFAEALGAQDTEEVAVFEEAVRQALRMWETPELRFDAYFAAPGESFDPSDWEITFETSFETDPRFDASDITAVAQSFYTFRPDRMLTNGLRVPGWMNLRSSILFNTDRYADLGQLYFGTGLLRPGDEGPRLRRLAAHEIGHTLGLDHPDEFLFSNLDTDGDPFTVIEVDPLDPFADLEVSRSIAWGAVMFGGDIFTREDLVQDGLHPDDRSGLNVLYPSLVPEPGTVLLVGAGLAGLAARRRRRSGEPQPS